MASQAFLQSNTPLRIAIIGYGNMGEATGAGLLKNPNNAYHVTAVRRTAMQDAFEGETLDLNQKWEKEGKLLYGTQDDPNIIQSVQNADLVMFMIKPWEEQIKQSMGFWADKIPAKTPIVHGMAGTPLSIFQHYFGADRPLGRLMLNTPVSYGAGMTGGYLNPYVTDKTKALIEKVLAPSSTLHWVKEEADMNAVTAVSGSGPAYIFHFVEQMQSEKNIPEEQTRATLSDLTLKDGLIKDEKSPVLSPYWQMKQGLIEAAHSLKHEGENTPIFDKKTATLYVEKTIAGAATMLQSDKRTANALRKAVTSKNGTTQAAIDDTLIAKSQHILSNNGFWKNALNAAFERGQEIEAELQKKIVGTNKVKEQQQEPVPQS